MPKTIREMLKDPQPGDYWVEPHGPSVFVADVKSSGSLVIITDWLTRGGHHPDYTRAREVSFEEYEAMLVHTTQNGFVGKGYRSRAFTLQWVDVWRNEFHGSYALNLDLDEDYSDNYDDRWNTIH